jgi:hypothetical protein
MLASVTALTLAGVMTACGGKPRANGKQRGGDVEHVLLATLQTSTEVRLTHVRCAAVETQPWTHACTFQRVSPRVGHDDPLLVIGFSYEGGKALRSSGTAPLDIRCAKDVECWTRTLCAVTGECPVADSGFGLGDTAGPPLEPPSPTPPPTIPRCVAAWNAHGGFSPAEVAQETPAEPFMEVARPVYTPHLSGASLGFLAPRAEISASGRRCAVLFDVEPRNVYVVAARAFGEPRFWIWRGAGELKRKDSPEPVWNACQRDDGTLVVAYSCPPATVAPRPVRDELERGHLQQLADVGGFPYWLGETFAGARPVPVESSRAESAVRYRLEDGGHRLTLTVLTYRPPERSRKARGVVVARAEPEDATVVVVSDRDASDSLRRAVGRALRPFISTQPDAPQVPGDIKEEPTRIDVSAPVRVFWDGPIFEGFAGEIVSGGPTGASVVRYANATASWFIVTYTPRKKKHCSRLGCVSPPPLPAVLRRYGRVVETILPGDLVIVVLARRPGKVPAGALIYEHLHRAR